MSVLEASYVKKRYQGETCDNLSNPAIISQKIRDFEATLLDMNTFKVWFFLMK